MKTFALFLFIAFTSGFAFSQATKTPIYVNPDGFKIEETADGKIQFSYQNPATPSIPDLIIFYFPSKKVGYEFCDKLLALIEKEKTAKDVDVKEDFQKVALLRAGANQTFINVSYDYKKGIDLNKKEIAKMRKALEAYSYANAKNNLK
jgi:hypothetical protein